MQTIRDIADTLLAETPEEAAKALADAAASFEAFRASVEEADLRSHELQREAFSEGRSVYEPLDTESHEPPRNSGEGTAVNGPMPLAGESDAGDLT